MLYQIQELIAKPHKAYPCPQGIQQDKHLQKPTFQHEEVAASVNILGQQCGCKIIAVVNEKSARVRIDEMVFRVPISSLS